MFTWLSFPRFTDLREARAWISKALVERGKDRRIPFAVEDAVCQTIIGSTSYRDLDPDNARMEIGSTWLRRASWGTGANTESKLLLMEYAFESLDLERVFLRADSQNTRAQRAHEKLGAIKEGVHRHEVRRRDGSWCDSIHYSILSSEWPTVKVLMTEKLRAKPSHLSPSH